ncbi:MAG TPA: glycosyltransferase family A protein [Geobacteraceae bacterium]|nr:glycosyltransferase family A protein [Geobacteraceae bacterium]
MDLSLVICTRNRGPYLLQTLRSLAELRDAADWELVVVNNGSTDDTGEIIERFRPRFGRPLAVVDEPRPGLGRARNSGWRRTRGRVVAFTDDDCYPAHDYLRKILECFEGNDIGFVGGMVLLHDPTDYPITIQTLDRPVDLQPGEYVPAGLIQGANFAFLRSALEAVGGFDDRMGAGTPFACEDVDILARLLGRGIKGAYSPRPLVYHHHRRKTDEEASRLSRAYDYGRGAYFAKCLLDPALRKVYAKQFYWQFRGQGFSRNARVVAGAAHFLLSSLFAPR